MPIYPETRPTVICLSTKKNKVNTLNLYKAKRAAAYVFESKAEHTLVLAEIIKNGWCLRCFSYGEHTDRKSQSGGIIGFES